MAEINANDPGTDFEPGLYYDEQLLDEAQADPAADDVAPPAAPPDLVSSLGSLVDEQGNVAAAEGMGSSHNAGEHMGHELNVHDVYDAATDMGIDADKFIADFVADDSNFNPGQSPEQKVAGALTVLNDMTAAVTMGGLEGDSTQIAETAAKATVAALDGDAETLRSTLTEAGGDVRHLSDEQLLNVWATNSHMYNHKILDTGPESDAFALTHLRSLNSVPKDGTEANTLGFYNNTGQYPQGDAVEAGQDFLDANYGGSFPTDRLVAELSYA